MHDLIVKNGRVVLADEVATVDIAVKDGRIARISLSTTTHVSRQTS
mgnify:CR=1 FL=1